MYKWLKFSTCYLVANELCPDNKLVLLHWSVCVCVCVDVQRNSIATGVRVPGRATHAHALPARHRAQRPQRTQRAHRSERRDVVRARHHRTVVYERQLTPHHSSFTLSYIFLLHLYLVYFMIYLVFHLQTLRSCSTYLLRPSQRIVRPTWTDL